jgi:amidase
MRRLLVLALACVAVSAAPAAGATDCVRTLRGIDLQTATIPELQQALAAKRITSVELVDAYLARMAAYPQLNAIRDLAPGARERAAALDAERAAGHVRGPLHGIPVLLKDNIGTVDEPTTAGSIALEGVVPAHDATVTARLRDAGAVILGKLNLSEFAGWVDLDMPPGYSSLGGQVVNAYDPELSPSGSSAGSGVAASMAFSAITLGTETSGSILSPSDANSAVGVKTTLGLVSRYGILPLAPSFDVPGPIVRTVTDAALALGALAGPDPNDPETADAVSHLPPGGDFTAGLRTDALRGVRLAYSQDDHDGLDDERQALFDAGIERLRKLGATVTATDSLGSSQFTGLSEIGAIPNEFKASLNRYLAEEMASAPVDTLSDIIAYNEKHPDKVKYGQGLLQASDASPGREELFPVQAEPARQSARAAIDGALTETQSLAIITPGNAHANVGAAAGYPTVIVPLGYTDGGRHPFGIGFLSTAYTEPQLLGYAYAYEQASRARVAPTDVNPDLAPAACPAPGSGGGLGPLPEERPGGGSKPPAAGSRPRQRALRALRVTVRVRRRGRVLRIRVNHALSPRVRLIVRRGKRTVRRRTVRTALGLGIAQLRVARRGRYRVTILDPGPPARTVRKIVRVR